jgi:hypothetical protein
MKKLILLLIMILSTISINAQLKNENVVHSEVIEVELSKKNIYQKINEWIAVNYKSAKDVIQLNTEDKIIIKGNYIQIILNNSFRIHHSLTFSIRDNKYKIDLIPNDITTSAFKLLDNQAQQILDVYAPEKLDRDAYNKIFIKNNVTVFKSIGWSDKKIKRKFLDKPLDEKFFNEYLENKSNWDKSIEATFQSIKSYISQSNSSDDW